MKTKFLFFPIVFLIVNCLLPITYSFAQIYPSQNINLLSNWDTSIASQYYDVCGWANPQDNREYAIIGSYSGSGAPGAYFIDVTNPSAPVMRDYAGYAWAIKTYQNYCYIMGDSGLKIADLSYLPDSVHIVYNVASPIISTAHTIFIDGDKLYCASVWGSFGPSKMAVFSLSNPEIPVLLRKLEDDYPSADNVHDMFVRNDTVYASSMNAGLFVYTYDSVANKFSLIASLTHYPNQGYNHSSALAADGKILLMCDEVPAGINVNVVDVSDMGNISIKSTIQSNVGATPHNPYIIGNKWAIIAYYEDGVYIYDISNPSSPVMAGYFDTYPQNGSTYNGAGWGCYGAYVELPSGIILVSDIQNGLFVLNASIVLNVATFLHSGISIDVYPNPFTNNFQISFPPSSGKKFSYELTDITGKIMMKKQIDASLEKTSITLDGKSLCAGVYFLKVEVADIYVTKKLIKTN